MSTYPEFRETKPGLGEETRVARRCRALAPREGQRDDRDDSFLARVDGLVRSSRAEVGTGFEQVNDELWAGRSSIDEDRTKPFRTPIEETIEHGSVAAQMRKRFLAKIGAASERRQRVEACARGP